MPFLQPIECKTFRIKRDSWTFGHDSDIGTPQQKLAIRGKRPVRHLMLTLFETGSIVLNLGHALCQVSVDKQSTPVICSKSAWIECRKAQLFSRNDAHRCRGLKFCDGRN